MGGDGNGRETTGTLDDAGLIQLLRHPEPGQLLYQFQEIVFERTYLRHGIEVRPGDVVLDVGANAGVAAAFFAGVCGAGLVHSFEPVAPIFEILRANVATFPQCVPHPYGLADRSGTARVVYYPRADAMSGLHADPASDADFMRRCLANLGRLDAEQDAQVDALFEPVELTCELRTLAAVIAEEAIDRVDLLKIDVEGAELEVLDGMDDADWPLVRQVVLELHDHDGRLGVVVGRLARLGFTVTVEQEPAMRGTEVHVLYARR